MPHLRSGVRGDLYAHVDVVVPAKLDHKDSELLQALKAHRTRDVAVVRSTHAGAQGNGGGIFSRLRETFSGR
jgi:molecular chaperone DnaJ